MSEFLPKILVGLVLIANSVLAYPYSNIKWFRWHTDGKNGFDIVSNFKSPVFGEFKGFESPNPMFQGPGFWDTPVWAQQEPQLYFGQRLPQQNDPQNQHKHYEYPRSWPALRHDKTIDDDVKLEGASMKTKGKNKLASTQQSTSDWPVFQQPLFFESGTMGDNWLSTWMNSQSKPKSSNTKSPNKVSGTAVTYTFSKKTTMKNGKVNTDAYGAVTNEQFNEKPPKTVPITTFSQPWAFPQYPVGGYDPFAVNSVFLAPRNNVFGDEFPGAGWGGHGGNFLGPFGW